ncbi:MAG: helix-turn-helix transcriptional regulator, partial [Candidatus Wallbacteria bacterium]|nr:helix-turn-helix transcriptional regulator [Candidatus Wallbacteria bacterium]
MDLKALREFAGKTQADLAKSLKISQAELSRAEAREAHRLSTLDRFVKALGGGLELVAHIGDTSIRLTSVRPLGACRRNASRGDYWRKTEQGTGNRKQATGNGKTLSWS